MYLTESSASITFREAAQVSLCYLIIDIFHVVFGRVLLFLIVLFVLFFGLFFGYHSMIWLT